MGFWNIRITQVSELELGVPWVTGGSWRKRSENSMCGVRVEDERSILNLFIYLCLSLMHLYVA